MALIDYIIVAGYFLVMLVIGWLLYKWGDSIAPKFDATREKIVSYACGHNVPEGKPRPNYGLFHVAFIFTILHIVALMAYTLTSLPTAALGGSLMGLFYMMVVLIAVYAVTTR